MEKCGLVREGCERDEFCRAFALLEKVLQTELSEEEKDAMGYNVIMLEHALCKIKQIGVYLF